MAMALRGVMPVVLVGVFLLLLTVACQDRPVERDTSDEGDPQRIGAKTPTTVPATPPRAGSVRLANGRTAAIVRVGPRGLIPAVFDPVHVPAADVGDQVGQASLVIGVSIGGESVAYSVTHLSSREIVNDTVGGTPIVVTW